MPLENRIPQVVNSSLHSVHMENREKMTISGVEDVASFTEENIVLLTNMGTLTVKGNDLHINKLNVESGELVIDGSINLCEYSDKGMDNRSGGFFAKLFK